MSLTVAFTAGQNPTSPSVIVVTDTSGGSDGAVVSRRVYLTDSAGNPVVPSGTTTDYVAWAIADASIAINCLQNDAALSIRVDWLSNTNAVLYTLTQQFCFSTFSKQFLYYLIQLQGLSPQIPADNNYNLNVAIFWANILGAINAIELADDLSASQNCLNRCIEMKQNQSKYF